MKLARSLLVSLLLVAGTALRADESPEARFATMSADEVKAYETDTLRRVADLALIPPVLNTSPLPRYDYDRLDYGMTIGIERTPKGRLWACWVAGGDSPKAFFVLATSDDDGETWSKPRLVVDAHARNLPRDRSVLVGNLWTDPLGRLWLFFDQSMEMFDGRAGVWASVCDDPDAEHPAWSAPRRIWHGVMLNKPTVLSTGEWMLPISLNQSEGQGPFQGLFKELDPFRGANVFVSTDRGATWQRRGAVKFPDPDWLEHMIVERKDGSLWMLARTRKGIMQSTSTDGGRSWAEPTEPPGIRQPNARFHVRRLASGRVLLVKHGDEVDAHEGRVQLSAWLSDDEGATWQGGLVLDERKGISYPDGFQAPDGTIYISYDRNRATDGEILLARFSEADVLAKRLTGPKSKLKMLISRPLARAAGGATTAAGGRVSAGKKVFAHYMVCCPTAGGSATLDDYKREITEAQKRGIDGFALNCGNWEKREPHYKARTLLIYEAARQLGTGFQLFVSLDGEAVAELQDVVRTLKDHPNQFRHDGRPVLSTFGGQGGDDHAAGNNLARAAHDAGTFFVPYYYPRPNITELPTEAHVAQLTRDFPELDGYFYFGGAGTGEQIARCNSLHAKAWLGLGKVFMAGVTPYYRANGGNFRCFETRGFEGMAREWEAAISSGATWVELVTWNDWNESSYLSPFGGPADTALWKGHFGPKMLSHAAYLDASRHYIEWFKTGSPPVIVDDRLFYFYRLHPASVSVTVNAADESKGRGRPQGADALIDHLFVTTFLSAPARLTLHSGPTSRAFDLPAGVQHVAMPFASGAQRFVLQRDGETLVDKTGEHDIDAADGASRFNYFSGGATRIAADAPPQ